MYQLSKDPLAGVWKSSPSRSLRGDHPPAAAIETFSRVPLSFLRVWGQEDCKVASGVARPPPRPSPTRLRGRGFPGVPARSCWDAGPYVAVVRAQSPRPKTFP